MKFFILAGGYGRRALPLSLEKPKPLFPLGGLPLIRLLLVQVRKHGCRSGFVNLHHLAEQIRQCLAGESGISFLEEKRLSGSRILRRALPQVTDSLLTINGDTFMEIPLPAMRSRLEAGGVDAVLAVRPAAPGYGSLEIQESNFLRARRPQEPSGRWMYAGAALFTPRALEAICDENFFLSLEKAGLRVACISLGRGAWYDIGTPGGYFHAVWNYMRRAGDRRENALSTGAHIAARARVRRSIIWEGGQVAAGAVLERCIVGAGVHVPAGRFSRQMLLAKGIFPLATVR